MLRLALALFLLTPMAQARQGDVTGLPLPREAVVLLEGAVRAEPGREGTPLLRVPACTPVVVTDEREAWRRVTVGDVSGWMHQSLLRPLADTKSC